MLSHILQGEIKKGKCFGIHFFDPENHLVDEIIHEANNFGIWEANIKIKHPKTGSWVVKEKSSTFFPSAWTQAMLITKLEEAFEQKTKLKPYKYKGTTSCGVSIAFFFKENVVVGCYPLFE